MPKGFPPSIVLASVLSIVNIVIICLPGEDTTGMPHSKVPQVFGHDLALC